MKINILAKSCHDFFLDNEELCQLYDNYADSEIYAEIVDFLDIFQPHWRKLKGLGKVAPEYILAVIENCDPFDEATEKYTVFLTRLFLELVDRYEQYQSCNNFHRNDIFSDAFVSFYQSKGFDNFEEPSGLTNDDYANNQEKVNNAWMELTETENRIFAEFQAIEDEKIYVWF